MIDIRLTNLAISGIFQVDQDTEGVLNSYTAEAVAEFDASVFSYTYEIASLQALATVGGTSLLFCFLILCKTALVVL